MTVRAEFQVTRNAAAGRRRPRPASLAQVRVERVHPAVMAQARLLAAGDMARVQIISPTEVLVRNQPLRSR